jgi:hypothetical protein
MLTAQTRLGQTPITPTCSTGGCLQNPDNRLVPGSSPSGPTIPPLDDERSLSFRALLLGLADVQARLTLSAIFKCQQSARLAVREQRMASMSFEKTSRGTRLNR